MALVGSLSGSSGDSYQTGITGSLVIARPGGATGLAWSSAVGAAGIGGGKSAGNDTNVFISGSVDSMATVSGQHSHGVTAVGGDLVTSGAFKLERMSAPSTTTDKLYNVAGTLTWAGSSLGAGGSPGGSDTQIQYNNASSFGGISQFTYDDTNLTLSTTTKLMFRDSGLFVHSPANGQLGMSADGNGATALVLSASNAAGGIDIDAGTGGIAIDSTGVVSIDAVGASNLTTNGALTVSGSTALNLASDGGEIDITTRLGLIDINATAGAIDMDAAGAVTIDSSGAAISIGADDIDQAINIGTQGERTVSISTGAFASTLALGNVTGATTVTLKGGTGGIDIDCGGATGALALDTAGGDIEIGANAAAGDMNIGTNGTARTITIGNTTGATGVVIDCGTGDLSLGASATAHEVTIGPASAATDAGLTLRANTGGIDIDCHQATGVLALDTAGGDIEIGVNAAAGDINIGTNATARTVTVGNTTGATAVAINAGSGDVTVTGDLMPASNATYSLGASGTEWLNIHTTDLHLNNGRGHYTIVEEVEVLTVRNNKTGRWYKLLMEEIDPTGRDEGMAGGEPPVL